MTTTIFLVGGAVRDIIMGVEPKDWDFSVESESFETMRAYLQEQKFVIFVEKPEYLTIRAKFPHNWEFAGRKAGNLTADFVLARKDGVYTDGRRPDSVAIGTIYDDLARRDFTINAIAMDGGGNILDPHGGAADISMGVITAVGSAYDRLTEDALRMVRAIRFAITKGFMIGDDVSAVLRNAGAVSMLDTISTERIREEMFKAFSHDTLATMKILEEYPKVRDQIFGSGGLWMKPTMEKR